MKQDPFVSTDLRYEFVEKILKSGNPELKAGGGRWKIRKKGRWGKGETAGKWRRKGGRVRDRESHFHSFIHQTFLLPPCVWDSVMSKSVPLLLEADRSRGSYKKSTYVTSSV